jgi:hypothetical protein
MTTRNDTRDPSHHPIREALGSHPVGLGVGGVVGGAAAGALAGTVFGPIGTLIGAGVGVVAGAAAGRSVAERIEPHGEKEYWRNEHANRPYIDADRYDFDRDYAAAYGYGLQVREQYGTRDFEASDDDLREGWDLARGDSRLEWDEAREAARDAWFRADRTYNTYDASDRYFAARFDEVTYAGDDETFEDYRPAYRYGVLARTVFRDHDWDDDIEQQLRDDWDRNRGTSPLSWERARAGVQDAYASPYIDYNSPFDDKPDFITTPPLGAGVFRVR